MIDLDFIEIGTSDFDTLIEKADDSTRGISIEPIRYYLDKLPNKSGVTKLCCAIKAFDTNDTAVIHYIPEHLILQNKQLATGMRGCNSINRYHHKHILHNVQHLVTKEVIKQISIEELYLTYNIKKVKTLKIDTEGCDLYILDHLEKFLVTKNVGYYPDLIIFEHFFSVKSPHYKKTVRKFEKLGYIIKDRNRMDTHLQLVI